MVKRAFLGLFSFLRYHPQITLVVVHISNFPSSRLIGIILTLLLDFCQ